MSKMSGGNDFIETEIDYLPGDAGQQSDAGFVPVFNMPGDSRGETNGLYAGVTDNETMNDGLDYLRANPGTRGDFLSSVTDWARGLGSAAQSVSDARTRMAVNNRVARQASQPTIGEQWNALSTFEKFGFLAALLGLIYAAKQRG